MRSISFYFIYSVVGDGAGIVGDNVDNQYVSAGCAIVKEQAEADDDTTIAQRAGMALGTGLQETSGLVDNEIVGGNVTIVFTIYLYTIGAPCNEIIISLLIYVNCKNLCKNSK